jgi:hypothetical protein
MRPLILLVLFITACAGRAELLTGGEGGSGAAPTSVCPDDLKKLTELSIGIGIAVNDMLVRNAQACRAIRQELGASPPELKNPLEPGETLAQCEAAAELLAAAPPAEATWDPVTCTPSGSESLCLEDCEHPSCPELCDAIAVAFGSCALPDVTVSSPDAVLAMALEIHLRSPAQATMRLDVISDLVAGPLFDGLAAIDPADLPAQSCTDLLLSLSQSSADSIQGLEETAEATLAILEPVLP